MSKGKILMLMRKYDSVSGHGTVVNNFCIGLEKLGFDITLGSLSFLSEPPPQVKKLRMKISEIINGSFDKNFDLIHNHQGLMNYTSIFTKKPFIFHYHGTGSLGEALNRKVFVALSQNKISKIICVSNASYEWIKDKLGGISTVVIHNGVDGSFFNTNLPKPYKRGNPQLLFVGNLYKTKKVTKLVDVMKIILNKYPNAHLQIVGDGKDYHTLKNKIKRMNLLDKIEMAGKIVSNDLRLRYSSCDIYISASENEACPLPPFEAMACSKPILLSNIPQHNEIISNSKAGKFFSVKDRNDIKTKITEVFEKRDSLGKAGRKFAEQNDWKIVCKKVANVYEEIMS